MDNPNYDQNAGNKSADPFSPENYKPNADELKLLAECRSESTTRGVVTSAVIAGVTYQSIKVFKPSTTNLLPKVGGAALVGFLVGRMLALPSCYEKFKNLPNSPIGDYVRRQKGGQGQFPSMASGIDTNLSFASITPEPERRDTGQMNSALNIDVYNSPSSMDSYTGDELNGPRAGGSIDDQNDLNDVQTPSVSYAELRRRNRENYSKADKDRFNLATSPNDDTSAGQPTRRSPPPVRGEEKNRYGDVWG